MTEIIKERSMIDDKYKWDLTKIYKTNVDFESDCKKVKNLITEYRKKYENHTMDNAKIFYDSIIDEIEIERLLEKLYSYSNLKKDEDVANTENQELRSKVVNLYDYASKNMFFTSTEMLKKDYSLIEEFYKEEPRLLEHENNLKDSFRYKKYMLSDEEENSIKYNVDKYTLEDVISSLKKPNLDPRDEYPQPILKSDILDIKDLHIGDKLQGTVRNVVDFGLFIDIGLHDDGLAHISKLSKQFIKHPSDLFSVGDIVDCYVEDISLEKNKVSLSLLER